MGEEEGEEGDVVFMLDVMGRAHECVEGLGKKLGWIS